MDAVIWGSGSKDLWDTYPGYRPWRLHKKKVSLWVKSGKKLSNWNQHLDWEHWRSGNVVNPLPLLNLRWIFLSLPEAALLNLIIPDFPWLEMEIPSSFWKLTLARSQCLKADAGELGHPIPRAQRPWKRRCCLHPKSEDNWSFSQ